MPTNPADRPDGDRPAGEQLAAAAPPAAFEGVEHPEAVAAAVAEELAARDDSRAFSADELRTAARGVVRAVGPRATEEIGTWASELLELLDVDDGAVVDRYAAMVAWRLVERFDETRKAGPSPGSDGGPSPDRAGESTSTSSARRAGSGESDGGLAATSPEPPPN